MTRNTALKIFFQSLKVVLLSAVISSAGGLGLQSVESRIYSILPLLVLLPALNNIVGDFGTITSSKFTSLLYMGEIRDGFMGSKALRNLLKSVAAVVTVSSFAVSLLACALSYVWGYPVDAFLVARVVLLSLVSTSVLFTVVSAVVVSVGRYVYKRNQDPDNFLIPIATSVADLGNMAVFALVVAVLF